MASQPQYIPQFIAPPGGKNDSSTTIIILFMVVILMVSMGVSVYFLFFRKVEGGKCKLDDEDDQDKQGIYEYDEDLECVLESCKKGYEISGTSCIKEKKVGDTCPGVDSRGTYKLDAFKNCILKNCSTGYKVSGDKCVPAQVPGDDAAAGAASTTTPTSYHRWMGDSDKHAVNAVAPINPSIDVNIGPGEDISKCFQVCDRSDVCGGFNTDVSRTLCSFKQKTTDPVALLGVYDDGVTYDFFAKKRSYPWMNIMGQDGTMDTPPAATSGYDTPSLEHCKTDCLNDTTCKGITLEEFGDGNLMCHRKASVGNLTNINKPLGYTWTWYAKN